MSTDTHTSQTPDDDPFEKIRQQEETVETLTEREDRVGAIARYILAVAKGDAPDDYDAELAGLPTVDGGDDR